MNKAPRKLVVLISGRGSNMQTIHRAIINQKINANIAAVVSNNPDAAGLSYAKEHGLHTAVLNHKNFKDRESFDQELIEVIDVFEPDFLILAGFMRILSEGFVDYYAGRLLNIHPSLLPKYTGLDTHKRVLEAGEQEHGASVHFVIPELDAGPVIMQARIVVEPSHTPETLEQAVLKMEHKLYPAAISLLCEGLISQNKNNVIYEGEALKQPLLLT